MKAKLPIDRHGFVIVANAEELSQAKGDGHLNVKAVCCECGKDFLTSVSQAEFFFTEGCVQHNKPTEQ